jgi:hypothetical protein
VRCERCAPFTQCLMSTMKHFDTNFSAYVQKSGIILLASVPADAAGASTTLSSHQRHSRPKTTMTPESTCCKIYETRHMFSKIYIPGLQFSLTFCEQRTVDLYLHWGVGSARIQSLGPFSILNLEQMTKRRDLAGQRSIRGDSS